MYAVIRTGGKQVKVEVGQAIHVEKPDVEAGEKVVFDRVISVDGEPAEVDAPTVAGATAEGTIEERGKRGEIVTFKYKPKEHSHRKQGHRRPYAKMVIDAINAQSVFERGGLYMIKGTFKRNDAGQIISFTLTRHTNADPYGSDIVCVNVSALAISIVNGAASLAGFEPIVETNEEEGGYLYTEVTSRMAQE